jgi:hypothetical protein
MADFPTPGPIGFSFPVLIGTIQPLRLPCPFPNHSFLSLLFGTTQLSVCSLLPLVGPPSQAGKFSARLFLLPICTGGVQGPPRFLGYPYTCMPCSLTPVTHQDPACSVSPFCLPLFRQCRRSQLDFRGSITQPACSLSTLRSAGYPCTTQDSLPVGG